MTLEYIQNSMDLLTAVFIAQLMQLLLILSLQETFCPIFSYCQYYVKFKNQCLHILHV